jgi:site-specific recombinase XerC
MNTEEIEAFLSHLVIQEKVATSTRNQALSALLFLLQNGYDIRTVPELLEHRDVNTTMIYTHVLNQGDRGDYRHLDR